MDDRRPDYVHCEADPLAAEVVDVEVVEPDPSGLLPVLAPSSELVRSRWTQSPGVQAAAAAATGFVAGAATLALLRRHGGRRIASAVAGSQPGGEPIHPSGPRPFSLRPGQTYLVQVRVLTPRAPE